MKINFSKHAMLKIQERKINKEKVEDVLKKYDLLFYDISNKAFVAISKIKIEGIETNLVVVFNKKEGEITVITVYPCKNIDKEIKRKEGKRWIRI